jgi:O-antigen ligase
MILFALVNNKEKLVNALILGTIVSAIITCFNIFAFQLNLTESLPLTGSLVNKLYITQRLYLGFLILISLIFLAQKFSRTKYKTHKTVIILLSLLLFSALFIVSSRSSILIAFILFLISAFYMLNKSLRYLFIAFISLTFLLIIFNNKTLSKRFLYSDDTTRETLLDKIKTHEPRYDIWKYSGQVFIEENPYLLGIGTYKTQQLLSDKYRMIKIERRKNWFIERNFNTHNQYLDFAISFGITGLFIFLFFINSIISNTLKNVYSLNLVTSLFLILLIENLFHRQLGSFLFSLIIILAIFLQNPKNEKNISS